MNGAGIGTGSGAEGREAHRFRVRIASVADGLCLAATPVFALMALWVAVDGSGPTPGLCGGVGGAWFDGMTLMYTLMSLLHAAPWLRRIAHRPGAAPRPRSG